MVLKSSFLPHNLIRHGLVLSWRKRERQRVGETEREREIYRCREGQRWGGRERPTESVVLGHRSEPEPIQHTPLLTHTITISV